MYIEIVEFLNVYHGHQISFSTLKKVKALDLHRRSLIPWRATLEEVNNDVQKELDGSDVNLGYHKIWAGWKKQKILVRIEGVRKTILELDAEGVH